MEPTLPLTVWVAVDPVDYRLHVKLTEEDVIDFVASQPDMEQFRVRKFFAAPGSQWLMVERIPVTHRLVSPPPPPPVEEEPAPIMNEGER